MKWQVFKTAYGAWRFSNLSNIGGDCATWREAYDEALYLASTLTTEATA